MIKKLEVNDARFYPRLGVCGDCPPRPASQPTFYKDVLPVLQKNCQNCHRPGEAGPMSLLTYESTRPWAKAIKTAVRPRRCRRGSPIRTTASSPMTAGCRRPISIRWFPGSTAAPRPAIRRMRRSRWRSPKAGRSASRTWCLKMPTAFDVPASGTIDYQYVRHAHQLHRRQIRAVRRSAAERPRARASHHRVHPRSALSVDEGRADRRAVRSRRSARRQGGAAAAADSAAISWPATLPGTVPDDAEAGPGEAGSKAAADIIFQLHYTGGRQAGRGQEPRGHDLLEGDARPSACSRWPRRTPKFAIPAGRSQLRSGFEDHPAGRFDA